MIKIFINSQASFVEFNSTVLEACDSIGIEIPRFCFHERLSIAGNCRMCLVELEKFPKPIASCTMPVMNNMQVFTNTPLVKKAREGILEFLLLNHPLDCPICDQGGECDLQDQAMIFGSDRGRFFEEKRCVDDKNSGLLVKTIMTRCIHCTRCVRFASDIAGLEDLGTTNRGQSTAVGMYTTKVFQSEIVGNIIDLCPVGALTLKPFAFTARPWELSCRNTIDIFDGLGASLKVSCKETEIIKITPCLNEDINEEWISDKSRFNFDFIKKQRLNTSYRKTTKLLPCSWEDVLYDLVWFITKIISWSTSSAEISFICSVNLDSQTFDMIKCLAGGLGIKNIGYPREFFLNLDFYENFLCNVSLAEISESDFCLLIGINPKYEASMLNLKLRKRFRKGLFKVVSIGIPHNLTFNTEVLGISPSTFIEISEGKHLLCKNLRKAKTPIVLYGGSLAERSDFGGLQKALNILSENTNVFSSQWNGLCFLNQESNQTGAFDMGLKTYKVLNEKYQQLYVLLGSFRDEEIVLLEKRIPLEAKLFFISTHISEFIAKGDYLFPTTAFLEKGGIYMNTEGKIQKTKKILVTSSLAMEEISILAVLLNKFTRYKKVAYSKKIPFFSKFGGFLNCFFSQGKNLSIKKKSSTFLYTRINNPYLVSRVPFSPFVTNFYSSDSFSKFSSTMVNCSSLNKSHFKNFIVNS